MGHVGYFEEFFSLADVVCLSHSSYAVTNMRTNLLLFHVVPLLGTNHFSFEKSNQWT